MQSDAAGIDNAYHGGIEESSLFSRYHGKARPAFSAYTAL
jgi:hypothetical protein